MDEVPKLKDAYALQSADEIKQLYEVWANTYDAAFVEAEGYQLPREVALTFIGLAGAGPVLDVGAGTGVVGERLRDAGVSPVDALDLSQDMLGVAGAKCCYRDLVAGDVTKPLSMLDGRDYKGIVSAGTFTFGHVGAEALPNLLNVAAQGCRFVLSVNAAHYAASGFEAELAKLDTEISDISLREVRIYDDRAAPSHRDDKAYILSFVRT